MPILRDIAARLGLQLDKKSFVQAEKTLGGLTSQLGQLGTIVIGSGVLLGVNKILQLGSDANETLNVLNASFAENSQAVQDWAATFATEAGRSEFQLREMAGTLGAVLNPLMDQNAEAAAEMSKNLAALTVDLGSFFNATEEDVLTALKSGLVGQTEPMQRFGVVMQVANLEAFRLEKGITKTYKAMSIAEKTALRYQFILEKTANAQGDAIRTSEGWANATKATISALKDLGTRLGLTILPSAEKVLLGTRNLIRAFTEWQKGTNILKAALIVLGVIGAKVALGLLVSWGGVLLPVLKFIAVVTIAAFVLEDFLTFMQGGDSVIGRFIDSVFGPGSAAAAVDGLKEAWEGATLYWLNEVLPAIDNLKTDLVEAAGAIGEAWSAFFSDFREWVLDNEAALLRFSNAVKEALNIAAGFLGIDLDLDTKAGQARRRGLQPGDASQRIQGTRGLAPAGTPTIAGVRGLAPAGASAGDINNSTTVIVQGNATAKDAARIADAAGEAQKKQARRTRAALTQRGEV